MKLAMLRVDAAIAKAGLQAQMLLQVHDELVIEAPEGEVDATAKLVRHEMAAAYELTVPLQTEVKVGKNWGQMKLLPE
jgi:DNA polymerase-1